MPERKNEIDAETIIFLLELLIGPIMPIGETYYDKQAAKNLDKWAEVMAGMVEKVEQVSNVQCYGQASIAAAKQAARKEIEYLAEAISTCQKNERERDDV